MLPILLLLTLYPKEVPGCRSPSEVISCYSFELCIISNMLDMLAIMFFISSKMSGGLSLVGCLDIGTVAVDSCKNNSIFGKVIRFIVHVSRLIKPI